jgi:hypothetical protein
LSNFTIANGKNVPLNVRTGTIPNLGGALKSWYQPMVFTKIVKTTVAFQLEETPTNINFRGLVEPLSGRRLDMKPEGQRSWNWIKVIAEGSPSASLLSLNIDEVISFLGTQYRVMAKRNYSLYGFIEFELAEDYTGSGPN